jgi:hypothetical protein
LKAVLWIVFIFFVLRFVLKMFRGKVIIYRDMRQQPNKEQHHSAPKGKGRSDDDGQFIDYEEIK